MAQIKTNFLGQDFVFNTDQKLFSPNQIDPGSLLLLETVARLNLTGSLMDLGCGWGIMGIILAKLFPKTDVLLLDNDPLAILFAKENVVLNKVLNTHVFKADVIRTNPEKQFDLVVTNPPWAKSISVIPALINFAYQHLKIGGQFYMVINESFKTDVVIKTIFGNVSMPSSRSPYKILWSTKH